MSISFALLIYFHLSIYFFIALAQNCVNPNSTDNGQYVWSQTTTAPSEDWFSVTSSSTGQYLAAVVYGSGTFYTSNDYGSTWSQTSVPAEYWRSIASSSSGQFLAAAACGGACGGVGGIYISSNFGSMWTQTSAPSDLTWTGVASSSSGQYLVAIANGDGIYTSNNYGTNWTQSSAPFEWSSVTSSSDGQYLTAVAGGGSCGGAGVIYTSSNYGLNWIQASAPSECWWSVTSSSSGQYVVAVVNGYLVNGGGIYTSSNYGVNWTLSSAPFEYWFSVASSSTGQYLTAVSCGSGCGGVGVIYSSSNYGANWTQSVAPSEWWRSVASSSSGEYLTAVVYGGGIYTACFVSGPTSLPTIQPTMTSSDNHSHVLDVLKVVLINVVFIAASAVLGIVIFYIRKGEEKLYQFGLLFIMNTFVLVCGSVINQLLFATVLFDPEYNPDYGYCWVCLRGFFLLIGVVLTIWVIFSDDYSSLVYWEFISNHKKISGIFFLFMFFQAKLLQFLPFYKSKTTEDTLGFPTFFLYYLCSFLTAMESFVLSLLFILFVHKEMNLFQESMEKQLVFFLCISFTFLLGAATAVESVFVGKVTGKEDRTVSGGNRMELPDVSVENPVFPR
jgi:hypothetical protein